MHVVGKDKNNPNKFAYELYKGDGEFVERVGNFSSAREATRYAEIAQRHLISYPNFEGICRDHVADLDDLLLEVEADLGVLS